MANGEKGKDHRTDFADPPKTGVFIDRLPVLFRALAGLPAASPWMDRKRYRSTSGGTEEAQRVRLAPFKFGIEIGQ